MNDLVGVISKNNCIAQNYTKILEKYYLDNIKIICADKIAIGVTAFDKTPKLVEILEDESIIIICVSGSQVSNEKKSPNSESCIGKLIRDLYRNKKIDFMANLTAIIRLVIWDKKLEKLSIFGDKYGYYPFYYYNDNNKFAFSTSLKSLLLIPEIKKELNVDVLHEYMQMGFVLPPDTLVKGVNLLRSGYSLEFTKKICEKKYFERTFEISPKTEKTLIEELHDILRTDIIKSFNPFQNNALSLSGGIDSCALAGFAHKYVKNSYNAYTIDIDNNSDEKKIINKICSLYNMKLTEAGNFDSSIMNYLPTIIWLFETIGVNSINGVIGYFYGKYLNDNIDTVTTGDGNDSLWGVINVNELNIVEKNKTNIFDYYLNYRTVTPEQNIFELLPIELISRERIINKIKEFYYETGHTYNDFIQLDDKLFMENVSNKAIASLKMLLDSNKLFYCPYSNEKYKKLVDSIPVEKKMVQVGDKITTKYLFKKMLKHYSILPDEIINRKKAWLKSPIQEWLRQDYGKMIERRLLSNTSNIGEIIDKKYLIKLFSNHRNNRGDYSNQIIFMYALDIWCNLYLKHEDEKTKVEQQIIY